jgi:hypothetical protein
MIWNRHYALRGQHAPLSASKPHWLRYDDDKFDRMYIMQEAAKRGSELHALAAELIRLGVRLPENGKTLDMYVNDGIDFVMEPELVLYVSSNCFGTADAISFVAGLLRIHDLKTGVMKTSPDQLKVYAAMFCIEYHVSPFEIGLELRIYQNDEVRIVETDPDEIFHIMDVIKHRDERIWELRMEVL